MIESSKVISRKKFNNRINSSFYAYLKDCLYSFRHRLQLQIRQIMECDYFIKRFSSIFIKILHVLGHVVRSQACIHLSRCGTNKS